MKKLFSILALVLFFAGIANAQTHNAPVTATSSFDCMVILPLTWDQMSDVTLGDCIAGQTRPQNVDVKFTVTGEPDYDIQINKYGPTADAGNPSATVNLTGTWSGDGARTLDASTGKAEVNYNVSGIVSTSTSDHGTYKFAISVDAKYTGI